MTFPGEPSRFPAADRSSGHGEWGWRLEDSSGAEVDARNSAPGGSPRFSSQADAESWLGETWRDLLDDGVDQVILLEGDREVYGPMSLHT